MEWSDLGESLASIAPLLGGAIGGPGGAALGSLISNAFGGDGKESPDDIAKLIAADPQAAMKLQEIQSNNKVALEKLVIEGEANRIAGETSKIESINATMRTEAISGDPWQRRWRPFWGYSTAVAFFLQMMVIMYVIVFKIASAVAVITALASLQVFWAVPLGILGVSAYQRGKEKRAALGENVQPLLNMFKRK